MPSTANLSFSKRLVDAFAMFIVAALSAVLLIYVAFGEAKRTYEQFQIEKLVAQGQVVQSVVETFVRPGLPVQQFVGFNQLAEPMVKADPMIDAISFYDSSDVRVFAAGEQSLPLIGAEHLVRKLGDSGAELRVAGDLLQVVLPVRSRFEHVGHVVLYVPRMKIAERVEQAFQPLIHVGIGASVCFALFVLLFSQRFHHATRARWIGAGFAASFIVVAAFVVSTLISVYAQGAQARAKSLADSLGQRLDDIVIYNLNFDDITGIIGLFGEYKRLNPDIRSAALIIDGKVRAHTDPNKRGTAWDQADNDYEYTVSLETSQALRQVSIKVALPRDIVMRQVIRSVKNFGALFVASGFFAALFMGLARSLQLLADFSSNRDKWSTIEERAVINLVKPAFFLAVFVEHLSYAFLPTMMAASVAAQGLPSAYVSAPFMAYYLAFALSLIPAGRLEARAGAKNLMLIGLMLAGSGLAMMAMGPDFWTATSARAISGVGQGVLFIGVQAYVLANSSPGRRTQAGGAIVFGFQAGMIAGMAIGSLLVSYVGASGIFTIGWVLALVITLYVSIALPRQVNGQGSEKARSTTWRDLGIMLRDSHFLRSVLLIGVPAKAILTGVILFALPLLLTKQGFAKEDIGQIIMVYAGAVILASHFASQRTDKAISAEKILFQGVVMSAAGLTLFAVVSWINWQSHYVAGTLIILAGAVLVGFAHGCINAPIVTHVTNTSTASTIGVTNVAAGYRLMERVGHVIGPMLVGQIFLMGGAEWWVLGWIGAAIFLMGALFLSPDHHSETSVDTAAK
jgi:predicted MFS family arabinose efflux permease